MGIHEPDGWCETLLHRDVGRDPGLRERPDHLADEVAVVNGAVGVFGRLDVFDRSHARGVEQGIRVRKRGDRPQMEQGQARGGRAPKIRCVRKADEQAQNALGKQNRRECM